MANIWKIPGQLPNEVLYYIGLLLERRDVARCVLVCRSWRTAMTPLVWSDVVFRDDTPMADTILQHPHWIHSITIHRQASLDQLGILKGCSELRSLSIIDGDLGVLLLSKYSPRCRDYREIVMNNQKTLQHFSLSLSLVPTSNVPRLPAFAWSPLSTLADTSNYPSVLTSLSLTNFPLGNRHFEDFWKICARLKVLELSGSVVDTKQIMGKRPKFPKLQELTLTDCPIHVLIQLECIIRRAHGLRKLTWHTKKNADIFGAFIYLLAGDDRYRSVLRPRVLQDLQLNPCKSPCWPHLKSISVLHGNIAVG